MDWWDILKSFGTGLAGSVPTAVGLVGDSADAFGRATNNALDTTANALGWHHGPTPYQHSWMMPTSDEVQKFFDEHVYKPQTAAGQFAEGLGTAAPAMAFLPAPAVDLGGFGSVADLLANVPPELRASMLLRLAGASLALPAGVAAARR